MNNKMIVKYARNNRREPQGVIVVMRNPDMGHAVCCGWALRRKDDPIKFTKSRALEIATGRALKHGASDCMPFSIKKLVDDAFVARCQKYFKETNLVF